MNPMSKSHWIAAVLLAVGHLASPSSAQKNYTAEECSARWNNTNDDGYKPVNSSRSALFSLDNSSSVWHVSTTSSAPWTRRDGELQFDVNLSMEDVEISEDRNGTVLCPWAFSGLNKKFEGARRINFNKTCDSLLSSECRETLVRLSTPKDDGECPNLLSSSDATDEIADACDGMTTKQSPRESPLRLDGSSSYCSIQNFHNILVPEEYDTINLMTMTADTQNLDFIDAYDALSRDSIPILLQFKAPGDKDFQAFVGCLPPDDFIADGSRKPQGDSPHGSLDSEDGQSRAGSWRPLLSGTAVAVLTTCVGLVM
ncbi:hypothetical protein N3K66_000221 [Trichothecium roseum]|uniref:Uncharacterized protein n=1 Tax=Trichothecium roseum TaxID=47278 RepID=A0ACC0VBD7_9HYPO|nr:hypothetical protein N3K66_000221 [Trichothecium roseum]